MIGSTVINAYKDRTVRINASHLQNGSKGMFQMGTGQTVMMKTLTTGRLPARPSVCIVRGNTSLHMLRMKREK